MTGCSIAAKRMGNDLITGKKKIADISSEMKSATASTEALGVAMNIFANVGFMLAIAAITKVVSELAQAQENATQAAKEATETYNDEISSINDYKTKLSELHEELNSGNLSYEETKTKRTELMSIQDELIEKFGTEKGAIESVTEAINGQVDALDSLNEKSYRDWISKADNQTFWNKLLPWGKSGLDQAVDYMETSQTVSFNDMQNANLSEELQAIQKEIDETIRKKYNLDKSLATFNVTGTPDEIKSQLENIRQDYLDLSKNAFLENGISSEVWEEYRKEAIDSINEVINKFDEGLEKHQETYQTYIEGMIKYDSEYSDEYATILQKRAALESAENSGNADNIQKARQEFMDAINNGIQTSVSDENIKKYFESLYPELQAEFDSWNFEVAINANTDGLANKAKEIGENFTAVDLLNMVNTDGVQDGEDAFNSLIDKAIEYGVCTDNSAEEVQKLIDLLVKLGIVQGEVQGSALNNETDIPSIIDSWNSLIDTDVEELKNTRKDLLALAEAGQLTEETFHDTAGADTFLDGISESLPEVIEWINQLVSSSTQLQSMSAQISKMSDMLADKKNGTVASASDLAGFDATVQGLESWEEFERVMGSSKSSMEECQAAANALATEWVNNGNFLANLTEENKDYYIQQLKMMGVENAEIVVLKNLEKVEAQDFLAKKNLNVAAQDAYEGLIKEGEGAGIAKVALIDLIAQEQIFSNSSLSVSGKISELSALASAYLGTAAAAKFAASTSVSGMGSDSRYYTDSYVQDQWKNALPDYKVDFDIAPTGSSNYKPSGGSGGSGGKDTKQTIDWIDRKLSVLRSNIDTTKTKFENLFNINSPKNLSKKIKSVTKELKDARKETSNWKSKLDKINISDSLKKQIQSGKKINLSKYSKSEQKAIKSYQTNWSGYKSSLSNENKLTSQLESLNSQRGKKQNLDTQIKQMRELQKADTKAINAYQKKANSIKLSKALKDKVKSGDYKIENYSSDTQALIQEYQGYIDKIRELETEKETLKGDIKDAKIEQYQLDADNASDKIAKSQAYAELDSGNYKEQNKHLEAQKKYIKEQYKALIQIAKLKGDTLEVDRLRAEKQKELNDLTMQEFDNIANTYDNKIGLNNNKIQAFQDQISLLEARGQQVGSALYTKQMSLNNVNEEKLIAERAKLIQKLAEIPKGTDNWYAAQDKLFSVESELVNIQIENANLQKSINQLKFDRFDDLLDKLNDVVDETNFLKDMLSDNLFDDNGMITDDGITAMGLTAQNYDVYLAEVEKYKQMLSDVKDMYDAGKISLEEYEGYQRTYSQGQRDAIKSANDAKKAVIDYVKQGLDAQNDALSEAIDKQKELLQSEKDLKDFQDRLADSNKSIADIQKQINALESDNSEENRKKLQQLKSDLANAQKDQEDLLYDRSISDQEDALDQMLKNSQEQAENYLKDSEKVFVDALDYINAHTYQVSQNLEKISKDTGYDISSNITNAWKDGGKAVDSYANILQGNIPNITAQIGLITSAWEAAEKAAQAAVEATKNTYLEHTSVGKDSNSDDNAIKLAKVKSFISANVQKATHDKGYYASLNQYIYDKTGGKVLSKTNEAKLADMLGVKISARELTGEQGKTDLAKILKALKNIGYSTGGLISIDDAIRYSGEDGIALVKNGEYILSQKQTDGFLKLAEHAPQLAESLKNMTLSQLSYPQIDRNIPIANRTPTVVNNTFDNRVTVEGVATDKIVKDFENVATKQAERVVSKINNITYAKGVRR